VQVDNPAIAPLAVLYSHRPGTCQSAKRGTLLQLLEDLLSCLAVRYNDAPDCPLVLRGRQLNPRPCRNDKDTPAQHTTDGVQPAAAMRRTTKTFHRVSWFLSIALTRAELRWNLVST